MAEKKYLTREDILNADDLKREEVFIPEWNNMTAWVRTLTSNERDRFEADMLVDQKAGKLNLQNLRARLVVECLVDRDSKDAEKIFKPSDAEALGAKSAAAIQRLFNVAQRLSGFSEADAGDLLSTPVTLD